MYTRKKMDKAKELLLPVPWGHVAAKAWGSPTDFPVLCVHGIMDNAGSFDRLIALLPKNYYYVCIDLPGHGFSSHFAPGVPLEFFNYVLTLRYILEELQWTAFHYIGHSLGGQLGTFYSIIFPDQIKKIVLLEGFTPRNVPNKKIIDRIRKVYNTTIEALDETKNRLYTRDEVMHAIRCKRGACLNTKAAEALLNRSVSEVGEMFKYNRDFRLKIHILLLVNTDQMASIISNLDVKVLVFITTSTQEFLSQQFMIAINFIEHTNNASVIYVEGNHDVHNNHPDRISSDISKFLDDNLVSKL